LIDYINNIDHYKPKYSKRVREYVISKRSWDAVKVQFINALVK
jgi:hypothetical protein